MVWVGVFQHWDSHDVTTVVVGETLEDCVNACVSSLTDVEFDEETIRKQLLQTHNVYSDEDNISVDIHLFETDVRTNL